MEKPLLLRRRDFITSISESINNADLPPIILLPIFEDLVRDLNRIIGQQLNKDSMEYAESLQKESDSDGG